MISKKEFVAHLERYRVYAANASGENPDWKVFVFPLRISFLVELLNGIGFKVKPIIYWHPTYYFLVIYFLFGAVLAFLYPDANLIPIGGGIAFAVLFSLHRSLTIKYRKPKSWEEV